MEAPLFTIGQATLGNPWLLLALLPVVIAPVWWWRRKLRLWPNVLWLILPFLPWIALSFWTALRWHKDGGPIHSSTIDTVVALSSTGLTIMLAFVGTFLGKGARIFIAYSGLINIWTAAIGALLCVMATSGNWI